MTDRSLSLYRASLIAPPVVGAVIVVVLTVFGDVAWVNAALGDLGMILVLAAAVYAVPYVLVVVAFLVWSRRKREEQVRRAMLVLPPLLAVLSALWWVGYLALNHGPEDRPISWVLLGIRIGATVLVVAYVYFGMTILAARKWREPTVGADAA